jgi:hypothetical protein
MKRAELELRKELALARLRIARMELALARTQPPSSVATVSSAVDLASSLLATKGLRQAKWSQYARVVLGVMHAVLGVSRAP